MKENNLTNTEKALRERLNDVSFEYQSADWSSLQAKLSAPKPWYSSTLFKFSVAAISIASAVLVFQHVNQNEEKSKPEQVELQRPAILIDSAKLTRPTLIEEKSLKIEKKVKEPAALPEVAEVAEEQAIEVAIEQEATELSMAELVDSSSTDLNQNEGNPPEAIELIQSIHQNGQPCFGEELELNLELENASTNGSYTWVINGEIHKQNSKSIHLNLDRYGNYEVRANNGESSSSLNFEVKEMPEINFQYEDQKDIFLDETARLMASPEGLEYHWDIEGMDDNIEGNNILVDFGNSGVYDVELSYIDEAGCSVRMRKPVAIQNDFKTLAPNAFTPNGDGINEVFIPMGFQSIEGEFKFYIFNEEGKLVYLSNSVNSPWNGKENNNGQKLPEGLYVWKVEVSNKGQFKAFTGKVRLNIAGF